jgi:hypothetical protein
MSLINTCKGVRPERTTRMKSKSPDVSQKLLQRVGVLRHIAADSLVHVVVMTRE